MSKFFNLRATTRSLSKHFLFVVCSTVFLLSSSSLSVYSFDSAASNKGSVQIIVRDSSDGKRVPNANVVARDVLGDSSRARSDQTGKAPVAACGRTDIEISAEGYHPLNTYFVIDGNELEVTVYLDSARPLLMVQRGESEASEGLKTATFTGFIYDPSGSPIVGGIVSINGVNATRVSDAKGSFELRVPALPIDPVGDRPGEATLRVTKGGQTIYVRENVQVPPGRTQLIIDVQGTGSAVVTDAKHKLAMDPDRLRNTQDWGVQAYESAGLWPRVQAVTVPASIRVGSNCPSGRTSCTVFTVYSLDAYTRFGLDDEWIASWNANSLKAGAIAFRTYGAYHVNHPINAANYDICNTTSCQVCDPSDSFAATNTAVNQTTGTIVVNAAGTDIFFAEYSAENNLGGCPDGFTGNNTTWPCLADPVDAGQTFNGHGRGMCQWGTQRWSVNQGKDFLWIANHYYNGDGNPIGLRNGVIQMGSDTIPPPPTMIEPGTETAPGSGLSTLTPTFRWEAVSGADGYGLYVSKFNGSTYDVVYNSETALGQPISGVMYTLPSGVLVSGGQYRWNLSSHIAAGYGTPNTFRNYFTVNASAGITGKVMTPTGTAIRNAVVSIVDAAGVRSTATTSSFGIYTFSGIAIGQTYTMSVSSKRYRFSPKVLQVSGDLANEDFVGQE